MGWGGYGKGGYGWGFPPMMMGYGKGKGKGLRGFSNEKKVWIGGFEAGETDIEKNKKLKEHMSQGGLECVFAEINKNGIAGAAYKTPEDVQKAVASLNGSLFEGVQIQVDIWQKPASEPQA